MVSINVLAKWTASAVFESLKIVKINLSNDIYTFYIDKGLKTTKLGKHQKPLEYREFNSNRKICVVGCLNGNISQTQLNRENLEGNKILILCFSPETSQLPAFLDFYGIDVTSHSSRIYSTSKANNTGLCLKDIEKTTG